MRLHRRVLIPTFVMALTVTLALAYFGWDSVRRATSLRTNAQAVERATALAFALDDAAQEEDRRVASVRIGLGTEPRSAIAGARESVASLVRQIEAIKLPPRAAYTFSQFKEARRSLLVAEQEVLGAAIGNDDAVLALAIEKWRLLAVRADALMKNFVAYHLRFLGRTAAEAERQSARALWIAALAVGFGMSIAVAFSLLVARAVVRPLVSMARTAASIADTGVQHRVDGADRGDEIGTLARAFNDMTERLVSLNARLTEADRRKDEFLGMLSHELRNPLAPIRNSLFVLDRANPSSPEAHRARGVAKRQVAHLTRLVDDLLDVTRIARGKIDLRRTRVDIAALARTTAEDHRAVMLDRALHLEVDVPDAAVLVMGDETRLAQVFGNLLHNAAKFTPGGGRVSLTVRRQDGRAAVHVRDTGPGIPPDVLPIVFEPFTQAKQTLARSEGGLGLGLALVKGLVGLHGGDIAVSSTNGSGTEFVVTLPLAAQSAEAAAKDLDQTENRRGPPRRVLVIDDNKDAAQSLAQLVQMLGHEVQVAFDAFTGLRKASQDLPDVVLCDIGLPGMDGYEFARQLRALSGERPVRLVAVSGYAQNEDVEKAAQAGFDAHVAKPPDPATIDRLLQ